MMTGKSVTCVTALVDSGFNTSTLNFSSPWGPPESFSSISSLVQEDKAAKANTPVRSVSFIFIIVFVLLFVINCVLSWILLDISHKNPGLRQIHVTGTSHVISWSMVLSSMVMVMLSPPSVVGL